MWVSYAIRRQCAPLIFPQLAPPFLWVWSSAIAGHFFPDIFDIPARQGRKRTRLLIPTLWQAGAVLFCLATGLCPLPGVTQDITALEVGTISRLLKGQIFREMVSIVTHV